MTVAWPLPIGTFVNERIPALARSKSLEFVSKSSTDPNCAVMYISGHIYGTNLQQVRMSTGSTQLFGSAYATERNISSFIDDGSRPYIWAFVHKWCPQTVGFHRFGLRFPL